MAEHERYEQQLREPVIIKQLEDTPALVQQQSSLPPLQAKRPRFVVTDEVAKLFENDNEDVEFDKDFDIYNVGSSTKDMTTSNGKNENIPEVYRETGAAQANLNMDFGYYNQHQNTIKKKKKEPRVVNI